MQPESGGQARACHGGTSSARALPSRGAAKALAQRRAVGKAELVKVEAIPAAIAPSMAVAKAANREVDLLHGTIRAVVAAAEPSM